MTNYIMPPRKSKEVTTTSTQLRQVEEPTNGNSSPTIPSRSELRSASAADVHAVDISSVISKLIDFIGTTDLSSPDANITPLQIDELTAELLAVRTAKDVIDGRETALKAYASDVINMRIALVGKDPASESGYLVSPENGVKLSKEVSGGKLSVDIDLLKDILDEDQFVKVSNYVVVDTKVTFPDGNKSHTVEKSYELNEEALERELKLGNIGMEQVIKATTPGKTRSAFYVRKL